MLGARTAVVATLVAAMSLSMAGIAIGQPASTAEPRSPVLLVVDTSGSMSGTRLVQAKEALRIAIGSIEADRPAGLRSYAGSCGDGGVLRVPVGVDNRDVLLAETDALFASGLTPTPSALLAAADDLPGGTGTIVLISDGQSTCGDPCPVATQLAEDRGIDFTVHTVGFFAPDQAAAELSCIADATGGTYVEASDEEELADAIGGVISNPGSCPLVHVVAVRGSGQPYTDSSSLNEPLATFVDRLRFRLVNEDADTWNAEGAIEVVSLDYPAVSADKAVDAFIDLARNPGQDPIDGNEYIESLNKGRDALLSQMQTLELLGCSETKVVLAGYSQGAQVVADSLFWLSRSMPDQIAAARLFGEPRFNPDDPASIPQTMKKSGIFGARDVLPLGPDVVESWCIPGDPICDNGNSVLSFNAMRSQLDSALNKEGRHSSYHTASVQGRVPTATAATSACSAILGASCTTLRFGDGLGPGYDNPANFRGQVPWQTHPGGR